MPETLSFSAAIKERTTAAHSDSEHSGFMADLLRGKGDRDDYTALVAQHWFVYEVLEEVSRGVAGDPVASALLDTRLERLPALEADLAFLIGPDWRERISPLPTTERYTARLREVADWPGGVIAHHYTRYLGDLSGGQFIGKLMARQFGFGAEGIAFYVFEGIQDTNAYKEGYRAALDAVAWDAAERERVIEEVLVAYRLNTELFVDLAEAKAAAASAPVPA